MVYVTSVLKLLEPDTEVAFTKEPVYLRPVLKLKFKDELKVEGALILIEIKFFFLPIPLSANDVNIIPVKNAKSKDIRTVLRT